MLKIKFSILFLLTFPLLLSAQEEGEVLKAQKGSFLLRGGNLVTVSGDTLFGTDLLIHEGKIEKIGNVTDISGAEVVDCSGKWIFPGLIDTGTRLGLVEVSSLEETRDYQEIGNVSPQMQALMSINPNAVAIPVTRVSGVTTVLSVPSGGLFPGTAALIHLNGYTPEQMFAGFKGVVLSFPNTGRSGPNDTRDEKTVKEEADEAISQLNEIWQRAAKYNKLTRAGATLDYYPEMAQLSRVIDQEMPLLIEVNAARDILKAIEWVKQKQVDVIFTGVAEGWRVAEQLAQADIPVITGPVLALPTRQSDRYDAAYANAGKLVQAGVKVAIRTNEAENVRNLPFHAGFAATYGLGKSNALRAVTLDAATILGLGSEIGSLDEGKIANLFVTDGDPFETRTQVLQLYIQGYRVPLTNRQIRLYQEFNERSPGLSR